MSVIHFDTLAGHKDNFMWERFHVVKDVNSHTHDFIELAYVESGSLWHCSNGQSQKIGKGDYFLIDYTIPHFLEYCGHEAVVINCIFRPAFVDATLKNCKSFDEVLKNYLIHFDQRFCFRPHSGEVFTDGDGEILQTLYKIEKEYQSDHAASMEIIRAYLIEIIILTLRRLQLPESEQGDDIRQILDEISKRYCENLLLEEQAERFHISIPYLSRKFTAVCGCSFKEYLQQVRIKEACRLLANTEYKISDIADRVGYHDTKFFNLLFRRYQSICPSEYRKRYQIR